MSGHPASRRTRGVAVALSAFATGLLLAGAQFALYFELQVRLSSSVSTYLGVLLAWLLGLIAGLLKKRWSRGDLFPLLAASIAPIILHHILVLFPFDDRVWLVAPWLIATGGYGAGTFFRSNQRRFREVRWLLFWENNGFVAGMSASVAVLTLAGTRPLLALPVVCLGVVLILRPLMRAPILNSLAGKTQVIPNLEASGPQSARVAGPAPGSGSPRSRPAETPEERPAELVDRLPGGEPHPDLPGAA